MSSLTVDPEDYNYYIHPPESAEGLSEQVKLVRKIPKLRKAKLKPPTTLERIFGRNETVRARYFTAGTNINEDNRRNVHKEKSPFKYPQDMEEFSYRVMTKAWRHTNKKQELKLKYNARPGGRTRQTHDLLNRLWVREPEVKSMRTIVDLDPDFFTTIEGRPVPQRYTQSDYIKNGRDILRTKIMIGYREDEILLIEEHFVVEQRVIDRIRTEFQKYVNTFEEFLFYDHTNSMSLLRQSEQEAKEAYDIYEIFRELSKKFGAIKSAVYNLEEKWRHCKMYQKFLYLMGPMEWRKLFDYYHIRKHNTSQKSIELVDEQSETSIFGRFRLDLEGDVLSLDNLIEQFLDDITMQEKPELFFTEPTQLLKVFGYIEIQNLNSLLHSEELAVPLDNVRSEMDRINEKFDTSMAQLQDIIDSLGGGIVWEEKRAIFLEELALELINGEFKALISNEDSINTYVFVEDVYENRISVNDSNLTMSQMMETIEMNYLEFLLHLDRLPADIVYNAEMHCYAEEARSMYIAKEAAKKVVQVERLMKNLARLLEAPVIKRERELKWRTAPPDKKKRPPPPPQPLTETELEYLTYFVDYCHNIDDPNDFGVRAEKIGMNKDKVDETDHKSGKEKPIH